MSNHIQQIQASYNPIEDRILFKLYTDNEQQLQAWITRRFLQLLLPTLQGKHPQSGQAILSQKALALYQAAAEKCQLEADYTAPYQAPQQASEPLGKHPILLTKLTLKGLETDSPLLLLEPGTGPGIQMGYQAELMGALLKVFTQAIDSANWQLSLDPLLSVPESLTLQ